MTSTESTPLLQGREKRALFPPINRVYFTSFLMSMTFAFTQSSLIYSFRTMTCDEWYKTHDWTGVGDRCALPSIESKTASSIALMSTVTTSATVINLFISGWWIASFGVKAAMFQQTAWAALRNLTQIYAQTVGGATGMRIIQVTQLINILGAGGGYQLCSNSYIATLSAPMDRTANFGILGGMTMLGSSAGFSLGGLAERYFGYLAPFQCAFCLLVFCTIFGSLFLPYLDPRGDSNDQKASTDGSRRSFLAPLKVFIPRRVEVDGKIKRDWNLFLLGSGAFCSVLATGYVAMALQLVATNVFAFTPTTSGFMLSLTLLVRAFFLSLCFPRIISNGRRWLSGSKPAKVETPVRSEEHPDRPEEGAILDVVAAPQPEQAPAPTDQSHGSTFDLYFLRYSILLDGILTGMCTLASRGWHMYLAAAVLPFASGTGPACKGVTLDFVSSAERADALSAIALIEKIAQVSTIGIFGYCFSLLSELGKPTMVFLADASIAILAFLLLLFVRMPRAPQGVTV